MPPKVKINAQMILDAAFDIVKDEGIEKLTARMISEKLKCSTQPILYHFSTIEDIKKAVYEKADQYHTNYIMPKGIENMSPFMELGINYIRFGYEEKMLFRFLFQTNQFTGFRIDDLMDNPGINKILDMFSRETGCDEQTAKKYFLNLFVTAHGCASLLANNAMEYEEETFERILGIAFNDIIGNCETQFIL